MDAAGWVFIVAGIVVVFVVGRLLALTGRRYVGGAGGGGDNVGSVATLLSIVFHLVTLGIVALIATFPGEGVKGFLVRLGVLLLLVGLVYGIFVGVLARRREVAITEAAVSDQPHDQQDGQPPHNGDDQKNPNVPSHAPSYLPPTGLPGRGDGT